MDPQMLMDHSGGGVPAPFWFVEFFKILGFTLHSVPMNLWYAGLVLALGLHYWGGEHGRRFGARLLLQMPFIVAIGVNLGVVPLLFVQLAYCKAFYPATILMAWHWLGIIALLIPAYYGIYVYAWALRKDRNGTKGSGIKTSADTMSAWQRHAGWVAAFFFLVIGFIFANAMSLLDHVERWPDLWKTHQVAGAALGTALNLGDPTLWPRWLLMFGLALGTTAVWVVVDSTWFISGADEAYHQWAWKFAKKLYTIGMIWTAVAGTWYVFGTWTPELRTAMFQFPNVFLTLATAVAMGVPWSLLMTDDWCNAKKATAAGAAVAQFGVLGINGISRQLVQNINLRPFLDVANQPTDVQWGPLVMFLVVFVLGLAVIAWMLLQAIAAVRRA